SPDREVQLSRVAIALRRCVEKYNQKELGKEEENAMHKFITVLQRRLTKISELAGNKPLFPCVTFNHPTNIDDIATLLMLDEEDERKMELYNEYKRIVGLSFERGFIGGLFVDFLNFLEK